MFLSSNWFFNVSIILFSFPPISFNKFVFLFFSFSNSIFKLSFSLFNSFILLILRSSFIFNFSLIAEISFSFFSKILFKSSTCLSNKLGSFKLLLLLLLLLVESLLLELKLFWIISFKTLFFSISEFNSFCNFSFNCFNWLTSFFFWEISILKILFCFWVSSFIFLYFSISLHKFSFSISIFPINKSFWLEFIKLISWGIFSEQTIGLFFNSFFKSLISFFKLLFCLFNLLILSSNLAFCAKVKLEDLIKVLGNLKGLSKFKEILGTLWLEISEIGDDNESIFFLCFIPLFINSLFNSSILSKCSLFLFDIISNWFSFSFKFICKSFTFIFNSFMKFIFSVNFFWVSCNFSFKSIITNSFEFISLDFSSNSSTNWLFSSTIISSWFIFLFEGFNFNFNISWFFSSNCIS